MGEARKVTICPRAYTYESELPIELRLEDIIALAAYEERKANAPKYSWKSRGKKAIPSDGSMRPREEYNEGEELHKLWPDIAGHILV